MEKQEILDKCNEMCKNTLIETLKIEFIEIGDDFVSAKMPVDARVHQPDGVLHGGATVALAESVGSVASYVLMNSSEMAIRGIQISANHVKSVREGFVYAKAKFVHKGRTTQLLDIHISDEYGNLISIVKLTTIALPKKS